ncbi:hypothetical protein GGF43_001593 [Coemansia sp. RSA 2618]|nr:hypothetical protein GGF43_001593 [Coemansia sp. RSA 2618]
MSDSPKPSSPAPAGSFEEFSEKFKAKYPRGALYAVSRNYLDTLSESRMRLMSSGIRAEDNWIANMNSPEIRARWIRESKEKCFASMESPDIHARWTHEAKAQGLTEREIDYVFEELVHYAALHVPGSSAKLSAAENVWISDSLIDEDTTTELKRYAAVLEDVPEEDKDYNSDTNNQVLNLVHPSLYPLIYARSRLLSQPIPSPAAAVDLKTFGEHPGSPEKWHAAVKEHWKGENGESVFYVPSDGDTISFTSEEFCWLPTEFRVGDDGDVTIESYINNLHPVKHAAFYPTIATIFSKFVPLLEHVITDIAFPRNYRVKPDWITWFDGKVARPDYYDDSLDYDERYEAWDNNREFIEPQPDPFIAPERQMTPYSLRGRRLQAIFKMSNIHLTPDQPEYEGGSWHVEAMANERIVATGIYYYDVENITESMLSFRESVDENVEFDYERGEFEDEGLYRAYGICGDCTPLIQETGEVEVKNGRCIVFPNIYQHQVSRFKLADLTKPGHCKTMTLFFIDPTTRIPSTEIVPPQQREWWSEKFMARGAIADLPMLVQERITKHVDFPISLAEAKELRLELMSERSSSNLIAGKLVFSPEFNPGAH